MNPSHSFDNYSLDDTTFTVQFKYIITPDYLLAGAQTVPTQSEYLVKTCILYRIANSLTDKGLYCNLLSDGELRIYT